MANMIDYLKWRGDLSLSQCPFGEVDNLILSYLAYVNLDGIAPGPGMEEKTVIEISRRFFEARTEQELKKDHSFIHLAREVMREMAKSARFKHAVVRNYVNEINEKENLQFSAMEIKLSDKTSYVAYRGTDDTIVGWKEDFNLSYGEVHAQKRAVGYLNQVGLENSGPLRVGGHSKGGNLCIYAGAKCGEDIQERIIKIYNNDGPGFTKQFLQEKGYLKVKPKILRIVPQCSVIGMLLNHSVKPLIIKSSQIGILQHDGMSWEVMGSSFVKADRLDSKTEVFNQTLGRWIDNIDPGTLALFVQELFSILEATGVKTLTELQKNGLKKVPLIIHKIDQLDPKTKKVMESLLGSLVVHWRDLL